MFWLYFYHFQILISVLSVMEDVITVVLISFLAMNAPAIMAMYWITMKDLAMVGNVLCIYVLKFY